MPPDVNWQNIAREEILFFGGVSAAISHEINNRLAVINEKAGLLEDMAMMLARGRTVDPERFNVQSRKIMDQIRQAKQTVRNLNRFAHSMDVEKSRIDVEDVVVFVVELYARKAAMANTRLHVTPSTDPVSITTSPFMLETLIGRSIDLALARVDDARTVKIAVAATKECLRLRFGGLAGVELPDDGQGSYALLAWLGARYRSEPDSTALYLEIPHHSPAAQGGTS